jgi:hypothetical protein
MKPTVLAALGALALAVPSCTGSLSSNAARQQIAELGDATLVPDDIQVQRIVTELGDRAVAETTVRMAFQFERAATGEWQIVAARLGDRQWIDVDGLLAAIDAQNAEATRASLERLSAGIAEYRRQNGALPEAGSDRTVADLLHPMFMSDLVRVDAWGASIVYEVGGDGYRLRSPGPDGQAGSADDIVVSGVGLPSGR